MLTSDNNSPTHSQSTEEFDWQSLLATSPDRPSTGKEGSTINTKEDSSPDRIITAVKPSNKISQAEPKRSMEAAHQIIPQTAKTKSHLTLSEKEKRLNLLKKERYKRYKAGVKKRTGYSSMYEARMHYLRTLEARGKGTDEQLALLNKHRAKKNSRTRRYHAKMRLEKNPEGAIKEDLRISKTFGAVNLLKYSRFRHSIEPLRAGDESDSSSSEFDWTNFLVTSPSQNVINQLHPHSPKLPSAGLPVSQTSAPLSTSETSKKVKQERYKRVWEQEKKRFELATPKGKEELLASKNARQAKHRRKLKELTGYTRRSDALLAQIRIMKEQGTATEEQLEYLRNERDKNRVHQKRQRDRRRDKLRLERQSKRTSKENPPNTQQHSSPLTVAKKTVAKKSTSPNASRIIAEAKSQKYKRQWQQEKARFEAATPEEKEFIMASKRARQANLSNAGKTSRPSSPHAVSSDDFDWTAYLMEDIGPSYISYVPTQQDHSGAHHHTEATIEQQSKPMKPRKEMSEERRISRKKSYYKYKAKQASKTPEEKQADLIKRREQQRRNHIKTKEMTGFTTLHNARVSHFRELESIGQASDEQLRYLNKDRERKRVSKLKKTLKLHASGLVKQKVIKKKPENKNPEGPNSSSQV
ncbi:uncharacterized protein FA14DRAFT_181917 [Meira miltonrushii]|uniref:Uncharacterized protein n=1 Tax=Meira miltonrushii TaxID=1280837 RepID=A0A316V4Q3_9BASI|nr:uncharacterized protein FA14DRAFT_181917 [Meira miltonrushii]PWN31998.1 hypothetical protein FA14DRAFT_181917 [Meira miltonrushii]